MTQPTRLMPGPAPAEDGNPSLGAGLDFSDPHSPLAPYYLRTGHVVLVALLGLFLLVLSYVPLWHPDIWGHLKFGQRIVPHGQTDALSPFAEHAPPGLD